MEPYTSKPVLFQHAQRPAARFPISHKGILLLLCLLALTLVAANDGTIQSLSASGGGNFNETITISTTVRSDSGVNNTNFYFEIRASDGTVVATHNFGDVPSMSGGETFSYSWTTNNSSYPIQGDYSLSLCWSTGNSRNCNIASATSGFYAANTLGPVLIFALVALITARLWKQRHSLFETDRGAAV
jgi:hypothetical protein